MGRLEGRVALITGAAQGIGAAFAKGLAAEGAKVAISDLDSGQTVVDIIKQAGGEAIDAPCDVSDETSAQKAVQQTVEAFGRLDILVNNAGIGGPVGRLEKVPESEWVKTIEVNLLGAYYCCRHAIPLLDMAAGGSIVNLSSSAGLYGPPNRTPYVSSKWGLIGLTKSLAAELGERHIRVNAICPGSVEGDRIDRIIAAEADLRGVDQNTVKEEFVDSSSMKVFIAKEDVAALVMFLCSDQGRYISGQAIGLDGNTEMKW